MTNTLKFDTNLLWNVLLFLCVCAIVLAASDEALASSPITNASSSNDAIGSGLCKLVAALSGNIAKSVATVAIIGVAGGLLMGKLNWVSAMTVAVGVIIIFTAGKLVGWISGSTGVLTDGSNC